jgi:prolyl-tRNA synthetase
MMHDGKALQGGTSHYFGDGFSRAFDITFQSRDNVQTHPFQTSWGVSTRMIGGIIMTHGDDNGLVLPPDVAPVQAVIIPVQQQKEGVLEAAAKLRDALKADFRVKIDDSDNSPGWKYAEYEMKGVPLRIELGPRDIAEGQCVVVRRDNREKYFIKLDELCARLPEILGEYRKAIYQKAFDNRAERTISAAGMDELIAGADGQNVFVKAMWCGEEACEDGVREKTGLTARCIPFEQTKISDACICCGKPAANMVIWGRAY